MKITFSPTQLSAYLLSIEDLDLDELEEQLKPIILKDKRIKDHPVFLLFNDKSKDMISELSMLVDSLKDLGLLVAGVISKDSSVCKFAEFLSLSSFKSVEGIAFPVTDIKPNPPSIHARVKKTPEGNIKERISGNNNIPTEPQASPNPSLTGKFRVEEPSYRQENQQFNNRPSGRLTIRDEEMGSDSQVGKIRSRFEREQQDVRVPNMPAKPNIQGSSFNKGLDRQDDRRQPLIVREAVKYGQVVKHDGDLVLLGRSERGSVINVTGSIYCYAEAQGVLLAGSKGDTSARILHAGSLQCEAIALSGLYVKYEQFAGVLKGQKMIMATKNKYEDKIDFSRLNKMPELSND